MQYTHSFANRSKNIANPANGVHKQYRRVLGGEAQAFYQGNLQLFERLITCWHDHYCVDSV